MALVPTCIVIPVAEFTMLITLSIVGESSSLDNSGGFGNANRGNAGDRIYATSVPVSVPMYRPSERGFFENGSDIDSVSLLFPYEC